VFRVNNAAIGIFSSSVASIASPSFFQAVSGFTAGLKLTEISFNDTLTINLIKQNQIEVATNTVGGILPTPPNDPLKFLNGASEFSTPVALISDGSKGDIAVTGGGATWTIANAVVSNQKLGIMPTKTVKARTSALTGIPEDITMATLKTDLALTKADVGLPNVDNTSDANKVVSTPTQT
jgi:hypothetical protein